MQLVNYAQFTQTIALRLRNSPVPISNLGNITVLTGMEYRSTNSFEDPYNVSALVFATTHTSDMSRCNVHVAHRSHGVRIGENMPVCCIAIAA